MSLTAKKGIHYSLDHVQRLAHELGSPEISFPSIHVAGSKGKGSVSTKIAEALRCAGYRVGLFTSPHIASFRERIQICGQPISEEEATNHLNALFEIADRTGIEPSFFEFTTLCAFQHFAKNQCDVVVLEAGMGGRLDATNIVRPLLSIITSIELEHTEYLGDTVELIAREKAGIIKESTPVVIGPSVPVETIQQVADPLNAPVTRIQGGWPNFEAENTSIAKSSLSLLESRFPLSETSLKLGLKANPPCRFEKIKGLGPFVTVFDVAHTPKSLKGLFQRLNVCYPKTRIHTVLGLSKGKAIEDCLVEVRAGSTAIYGVLAGNGRGEVFEEEMYPSVKHGVLEAKSRAMDDGGLLLITGSFFHMAEAREALGLHMDRDPIDTNERLVND